MVGRRRVGLLAGRLPLGRARGRSSGRHCTAGQYGYVPLGDTLLFVEVSKWCVVDVSVVGAGRFRDISPLRLCLVSNEVFCRPAAGTRLSSELNMCVKWSQ